MSSLDTVCVLVTMTGCAAERRRQVSIHPGLDAEGLLLHQQRHMPGDVEMSQIITPMVTQLGAALLHASHTDASSCISVLKIQLTLGLGSCTLADGIYMGSVQGPSQSSAELPKRRIR
eukprot:6153946-Amphidinium_carterae.1